MVHAALLWFQFFLKKRLKPPIWAVATSFSYYYYFLSLSVRWAGNRRLDPWRCTSGWRPSALACCRGPRKALPHTPLFQKSAGEMTVWVDRTGAAYWAWVVWACALLWQVANENGQNAPCSLGEGFRQFWHGRGEVGILESNIRCNTWCSSGLGGTFPNVDDISTVLNWLMLLKSCPNVSFCIILYGVIFGGVVSGRSVSRPFTQL